MVNKSELGGHFFSFPPQDRPLILKALRLASLCGPTVEEQQRAMSNDMVRGRVDVICQELSLALARTIDPTITEDRMGEVTMAASYGRIFYFRFAEYPACRAGMKASKAEKTRVWTLETQTKPGGVFGSGCKLAKEYPA